MAAEMTPEKALNELKGTMQSVLLSTVGENGLPHSGYTPFVFDGSNMLIFVSQLSLHTRDLLVNGHASAMLIADESESAQIHARTRVSYQCKAGVVEPEDQAYEAFLDKFEARHGKMIGLLRQLPDFILFRLVPYQGQFVMGFGKAFKLSGTALDTFEHATSA